jgi:hypothetical protein
MADSASTGYSYGMFSDEAEDDPPGYGAPAAKKRKLYASGLIRIHWKRLKRGKKKRRKYRFEGMTVKLRHAMRAPDGMRSCDPQLKKLKAKLSHDLKSAKAKYPDYASMLCVGSLAQIGYQVVSVEGASFQPTALDHYVTILFVRPV